MAAFIFIAQHSFGVRRRFLLLSLSNLLLLAPGSFLFHATLTVGGQLMDELAMMIAAAVWLFCVFTTGPVGTPLWTPEEERKLAVALAATLALWFVVAPTVHVDYNDVFQVAFLLPIIGSACRLLQLAKASGNPRTVTAVGYYIGFVLFGSALWLLDKHACDALRSTGLLSFKFGSLHGYWHVVIGLTVYIGPSVCTYLRLLQERSLAHQKYTDSAPPKLEIVLGVPLLVKGQQKTNDHRK